MSRQIKKIPYKFVHVFWIDIVSDSAWRSIEEVKESKCPRCLSSGFLISDEKDYVRLVSDFNFNEDVVLNSKLSSNFMINPLLVIEEEK